MRKAENREEWRKLVLKCPVVHPWSARPYHATLIYIFEKKKKPKPVQMHKTTIIRKLAAAVVIMPQLLLKTTA